MRKAIALLLAMILVLGISGCGKGNSALEYNDTLIEEIYAEEGSYADLQNNEWKYSFHVPQLISDSADGEAINKEIKKALGEITEESMGSVKNRDAINYYDISWESHWQESVLYLVVKSLQVSGFVDYGVYAFDFASGKRLDNLDILEAVGITQEDFVRETRRSAVACFDEMNKNLSAKDWYSFGCMEMRALTLSPKMINEKTKIYIDDDGMLTAICPVGSVAGASRYYHILKPNFQHDNKSDKATLEFVTAELKDGDVTVSFEKNQRSDDYLAPLGLEYGKKYEVKGLSSNYSEIILGIFGQDFFPYILMVSEEGRVEYVDIFGGLSQGYMCPSGSLPGISDIVSIRQGETKDTDGSIYPAYFAVNDEGEELNLFEPVTDMELWVSNWYMKGNWTSRKVTHHLDGGGSYKSEYFLNIKKDMNISLTDYTIDVGTTINYQGYLRYLGMNEKGLIYSFWLSGENNEEPCQGVISFSGTADGMSVQTLGGVDMFDAETVSFT